MKTFLAFALAGVCGAAAAQTPASNPMPDGSHDKYVGLGLISAPRYEGASETRVSALPVIQVEWSSGLFISGMNVGMHLSQRPAVEYGPLLSLHPGRSGNGARRGLDGFSLTGGNGLLPGMDASGRPPGLAGIPLPGTARAAGQSRLAGMHEIDPRLQVGGFFNYYLSPQLRMTSSVLVGAGDDVHGAILNLGVQRIWQQFAPQHSMSASLGVNFVNSHYNNTFFGVSPYEAYLSGNPQYTAGAGVKDVYARVRWNWALSPAWMVVSSAQLTRLQGDARNSPLAERGTGFSLSAALAYRF